VEELSVESIRRAPPKKALASFLAQGAWLAAAGIGIGLVLAFAVTRQLAGDATRIILAITAAQATGSWPDSSNNSSRRDPHI
jgi:hypothetical protein